MMNTDSIVRVGPGNMLMAVASMVVSITRLSRPLANTMMHTDTIMRVRSGYMLMTVAMSSKVVRGFSRSLSKVAHTVAVRVVGPRLMGERMGTALVVRRFSRPLANTMMNTDSIVRVGSGDMLVTVASMVVAITRLSRPLAKMVESMIVAMSSLGASCNIASGSIAVVSNSWAVIAEASFSSDTAQNGKNGDKFNCHGADGP